jgi:transposase
MKRYIEGVDRSQGTLLPEQLDDWVHEDSPVRVVDVFVDELNLADLGFVRCAPSNTRRPGYHPSILLKLYIYGYLNRIQSSRRLEREAGRNIEVMWLVGRLVPDHKTIADFRRDNGGAIKKVCTGFVRLCREIGLLAKPSVAIDGSKFKAVNNRDRNFTKGKLARRMTQIEESVARYLHQMDSADRQERDDIHAAKIERLQEKVERLRQEMVRLKEIEREMLETPDQQVSLTDPDSRSMATSGRGSGMVGYNTQTAVDTEHHLIVAHEVTNVGSDRAQLANMAKVSKQAFEADHLEVVADRGYFNSEEVLACVEQKVTVTMPKPMTSGNRIKGLFVKQDFRYLKDEDVYLCPAGERLIYRFTRDEAGLMIRRYWSSNCPSCAMRSKCTTSKYRRIQRWEQEHHLEAMQARLDADPDKMRQRRVTAEHPFGTIKSWMGATHFLTKRLPNVRAEMALHVLAYNMTRVMNIIGSKALVAAIRG